MLRRRHVRPVDCFLIPGHALSRAQGSLVEERSLRATTEELVLLFEGRRCLAGSCGVYPKIPNV